jgi:hypothetical protein
MGANRGEGGSAFSISQIFADRAVGLGENTDPILGKLRLSSRPPLPHLLPSLAIALHYHPISECLFTLLGAIICRETPVAVVGGFPLGLEYLHVFFSDHAVAGLQLCPFQQPAF